MISFKVSSLKSLHQSRSDTPRVEVKKAYTEIEARGNALLWKCQELERATAASLEMRICGARICEAFDGGV
jgi:hypothetical protein